MARQIVSTPSAPQPKAPISQAVRSGALLFVSGITPFDLELKLSKGDFAAQMRQTMENVRAILAAGGSGFEHVVKCTVLLARREDWAEMNRIYQSYWPAGDFPARTAFETPLPHPDFLVEVECVAEVPGGSA